MALRLAVFDIDGTLTDTCGLDAECFAAAVTSVFGVAASVVEDEWTCDVSVTPTKCHLCGNGRREINYEACDDVEQPSPLTALPSSHAS